MSKKKMAKDRFWRLIHRQKRYDATRCIFCESEYDSDIDGVSKKSRSIEHIIPKSKGGSSLRKNLAGSCVACNSHRGNHDFLEWGFATTLAFTPIGHGYRVENLIKLGRRANKRQLTLKEQFEEIRFEALREIRSFVATLNKQM